MQGESILRVVEPFPHVTGAWISRQVFVLCIIRGCVIGGSYFRFGDSCLCYLFHYGAKKGGTTRRIVPGLAEVRSGTFFY